MRTRIRNRRGRGGHVECGGPLPRSSASSSGLGRLTARRTRPDCEKPGGRARRGPLPPARTGQADEPQPEREREERADPDARDSQTGRPQQERDLTRLGSPPGGGVADGGDGEPGEEEQRADEVEEEGQLVRRGRATPRQRAPAERPRRSGAEVCGGGPRGSGRRRGRRRSLAPDPSR